MKKLLISFLSILFFDQINAQSIAYKAEDKGYITQIIETKAGKVITGNRFNDIYLLQNNEITTLISAPGCARYIKLSPDSFCIGFKYIHHDGLQQAAIIDLHTKKITFLNEPVPLCGQPAYDAIGNIYFTINNELIKYNNGIIQRIKLPLYVNFVAISNNGKYAAFADDDTGIYLFNLHTTEYKIIGSPACFYPAFSFDDKYLAYGTNPHHTYVYDIENDRYFGPFDMAGFKWHPYAHKLIGIHSESHEFKLLKSDIWEVEIPSQQIHHKTTTTAFESFANYDANGNIITSYLDNLCISKIYHTTTKKYQLKLSELKQSAIYPQTSTKADITVPDTVPYVHQVYDTPSWHYGYGSCAPTTSIMAIAYYNRLPKWPVSVNHGQSWDPHISNYGSYVADRYRFNEWYYEESADAYGTTAYGGYGYMWTGSYSPKSRMKNYIQNHYLTSNQYWTTQCTFSATVNEIDNGYVHPICCYLTSSGHLVLAIGYKSGQHTLIFNDPYGNKNTPGYPSYDGAYSYYDWPGYNNGYVNLDATGSYGYVAWTVAARGTQPAYSDTIIDDNHFNHGFFMNNSANGSHMRYFRDYNVGYGGHSWYTLGMASGSDICYCTWTPNIQNNGYYNIKAFIPSKGSNTTSAKYKIYHQNGIDSIIINQNVNRNQWVDLGTYYFTTSGQHYVYLGDVTGVNGDSIAFDCIKFSPTQIDNVPPTTSITSSGGNWKTQNFTATFIDTDNVGIEKAFYQVLDFDGQYWGANYNRGFFGDNFDILQPHWTIYSGTWNVSNGELIQSDESITNTNIYAPLNQNLSNRYLYHFIAKVNGSGTNKRFGFHFFCDDGNQENRGNSYFVWFRVDNQTMEFYKVQNNTLIQELVINNITTNVNQWYDFKITYDRITGKIAVWRNNVFLGSWTDPTPYSTNGNYISFRTGNCIMNVTELKVYRSRYPQVTVTLGDSTKDIRYQNLNPNTPAAKIKSIVVDSNNNLSQIAYHDLNVDWTPPIAPTHIYDETTNDIDTIYNPTTINAFWTTAVDTQSEISHYLVSISTQPCDSNVTGWINVGNTNQYTFQNLQLSINQLYYINVKAVNNAGLVSNCVSSDGFIVVNNVHADFFAHDTLLTLPNAYAIFTNLSQNAISYLWDFGDGTTSNSFQPYHLYTDTNTYTVKLYAYGTFFADSMVKTNYIKIVNNLYSELNNFSIFSITPIPANEEIFIHSSTPVNDDFIIYNIEGKPVKSGKITTIQNKINVSNLSAGWYCIKLLNQEQKLTFIKN